MVMEFITMLGPWTWVIFGLILLCVEIVAPSTFLLWPGLAALIVGGVTLIMGLDADNPLWTWQLQILSFLVLSLVITFSGRRLMKKYDKSPVEQPDLNERGAQLVGQNVTVTVAIKNGQGRVKIGDTTWSVRGPDVKAGQMVRVVGNDGNHLLVEPV